MPRQINIGTEKHPAWEELGNPNSVVNMPMERFRFHAGLCSWMARMKTLVIKAGLKKLYGDKLQRNSIKAFGRDLTNKEITEIKKGENAVFPMNSDVVPETRTARKNAKEKRAEGTARTKKAQSLKRKYTSDDEQDLSSEEDSRPKTRSHKRARRARGEGSVTAEVDDLVMFDEHPVIIDQDETNQRYSLRSSRREAKGPQEITDAESVAGESSLDEEQVPTHHPASSKIREATRPHRHSERSLRNLSAMEADYVPNWTQRDDGSHGDSDRSVIQSREGSIASNSRSGAFSQGQVLETETTVAPLPRDESEPRQPHPFEVTMNIPWSDGRNVEEEDTPLQAHRKRVREFLGDEEAEAYAPFPKRLRTQEPVSPLPGPASHGATGNVPSQMASTPTTPARANQNSTLNKDYRSQSCCIPKQELNLETARQSEQEVENLGTQRLVNYGNVPPSNEQEIRSLIDALLPTREVYFAWTGEPAPRTDPHQSYREQFNTILWAFQVWWGEHRSNERLPILAGVIHLGRSVDDWIPPCKDSIYYEAFRKGQRAPRAADGGFLDFPGPMLEYAVRMK